MTTQNRFAITLLTLFIGHDLHSMCFDDRDLPLIQHPFITADCRPSHYKTDFFVITANSAYENQKDDNLVGIIELFGPYQQAQIGCALTAIGKENPLETDPLIAQAVNGKELTWQPNSKLQAQGFNLTAQQAFGQHWSVGFDCLCMHVQGRQEFHLVTDATTFLSKEDILRLDVLRSSMNAELGIQDEYMNQVGFGDIILFLRYGSVWDCLYKFRTIQAGIRLGALIPTGLPASIHYPMSVPFGGDGHAGLFVCADLECEVKEDWKVGLWFQVNKRFSKTQCKRLPACKEQPLYGALQLPVKINPGATVIFYPYISFENLREGLGMRVLYSLIHHWRDDWSVACPPSVPIGVPVEEIEKKTKWSSEHVTLNAFYDFGKVKKNRQFEPILQFFWDIPVSWLASQGVPKAHKITIGLEFNF